MPDAAVPTPRQPAQVTPAASPDSASTLALQVGVVVVAALYFAREVLIPITLAILLAFILAPVVSLLRRIRLPRVPAVLLAVLVALAIILGLGGIIGTQVAQLANGIPQYAATVEAKIDSVRTYATGRMTDLTDKLGLPAPPLAAGPSPAASVSGTPGTNLVPPAPAVPTVATTPASSPLDLAERYLSPVLSPLATMGIVFVVAIFALLQQEDLRDRLIRLFGATDLHRTTVAIDDAGRRLAKYFLTQLAVNATFGVVIGAGLYAIGVPNPVLWGMLSGLLRFVPYIGSFISAGLPLALAAAVDPGWTMAIWTAALYVVVELTVSQAVEPLLYGHSTGLSPFAVVVSAIFWSWLWGPIGLILSMPLTLCLVVLGRHVDRLEFLDVMLGDRPALTPTESFYQRVLAGDADEVQDHAELLLKDRSLSSYYDEVALKGLQLAANDAERGVLHQEQLERIKNTIKSLVPELDSHDDREPAPEKAADDAAPPARRARDAQGAAAGQSRWRPSQPSARVADGHARSLPGRQGAARRGGLVHAGPIAWQARTRRPRHALPGRVPRRNRPVGRDRHRDGVHLLPWHHRHPVAPALPHAAAAPAPARSANPGGTVAVRGRCAEQRPGAGGNRCRLLLHLAPGSRERLRRGSAQGQRRSERSCWSRPGPVRRAGHV